MAYDAAIAGDYPVKPGYRVYLYIRRDQTDNGNNRSTYAWDYQQQNYATNTPSWVLDAKIWYVAINGTAWQGNINCDFRGIGYGGARGISSGYTGWIGHDGNGYLNVSFACSHVTGYWGTAEASGVLYSDRIPKPPSAPGGASYSLITPTTARATFGGSGNNNGATIDQYLFRYSKNANPETPPFTDISVSVGSLVADMTGLTPGVDYYGRTYAHNSMGWTAGPTTSFKTLSGAYVGMSSIFQGTEVLVGSGGTFKTAELYVGKGGAFVLAT